MTTSELGLILLVGAAVVLAAIVAAGWRTGSACRACWCSWAWAWPWGAGAGVRFDDAGLAQALGLSALVLILAESGLTTSWAHARPAATACRAR